MKLLSTEDSIKSKGEIVSMEDIIMPKIGVIVVLKTHYTLNSCSCLNLQQVVAVATIREVLLSPED